MNVKQCNCFLIRENAINPEEKLFKWCLPAKVRSWFAFSSFPFEPWATEAFGSSCGVTGGGLQDPFCIQESPWWQWQCQMHFIHLQSVYFSPYL